VTVGELAAVLAGSPARRLWLPWELPSLNDMEAARGRIVRVDGGGMQNGYNVLKREHQDKVIMFARRIPPVIVRFVPVFRFVERTRHRDPDGLLSAASKIVLDALGPGRKPNARGYGGWHGAGIIHCDGWHCVAAPPAGVYEQDVKRPGVEVMLFEVRP
jgi:hypothetical protein